MQCSLFQVIFAHFHPVFFRVAGLGIINTPTTRQDGRCTGGTGKAQGMARLAEGTRQEVQGCVGGTRVK